MAVPSTDALRGSLLIVRIDDPSVRVLRRAAAVTWSIRDADLREARDLASVGRVLAEVDGQTSWPVEAERWPEDAVWLAIHDRLNDLPSAGAGRRTLLWVDARALGPELLAQVASVLAASLHNRRASMRDAGPIAERPEGDPDSLGVVLVVSRAADENTKLLGSVQLARAATLCRFGGRGLDLVAEPGGAHG